MNENGTKRREWVKNVAIIFLAVMLVLTFFSNTIMNYSLPEVAAQYIVPGSITAKIRGTGTVTSGNTYNVQVNETRTVESVLVRVGDTVEKGDVLFVLADKESEELKAAQEALDALLHDFELQVLSGSISNSVVNNVQNGKTSSLAVYQSRIAAADDQIAKWKKEIDEIELKISQLTALKNQLDVSVPDTGEAEYLLALARQKYDADPVKQAYDRIALWQEEVAQFQKIIEEYEKYNTIVEVSGSDVTFKVTQEEYHQAVAKRDDRNRLIANESVITSNEEAKKAYENAKAEVANAQANLIYAQNHIQDSSTAVSVELGNWNLELIDKNKKLADANEARTRLLSDIAVQLNLEKKMDKINEQRREVARLQEKATGAVITAPITGTVSGIHITAGQDTVPASPIATMQPAGTGYTMSFSVSNAQARKLSVGMRADLVNAWRYEDVAVKLSKIKPDPSNPSQNKLLEFEVTGGVVAGQILNISVGDKSAGYDATVPNSAIREDNNGKFVLIVEVKSSPLGNRYKAKRMDIEVLASDDTTSAIKGALGYEFVITTSNKPVQAGQLVRLADQ